LTRDGRAGTRPFLGAEVGEVNWQATLGEQSRLLRSASPSAQAAAVCVKQAWDQAGLQTVSPERIGLVVGGSNFQQRLQQLVTQRYRDRQEFVSPSYGLSFWDSDVLGVLSQCFGVRGEGLCVGGASAGGAVAVLQAARQVELGVVDASIAVGPLCDLSAWELQALTNLGAMGGERFHDRPELACRPFDTQHEGFIFGEGSAAMVLEREDGARAAPEAWLLGGSVVLDGNRDPNPNSAGQVRAIRQALEAAGLSASQVDYVNTHGTGSPLGDATEVESLRAAGLGHCLVNATKSLTGHCLTAAGTVEAVATVMQLKHGFCHPTRNLDEPIDDSLRWVRREPVDADLRYAVSNSFAFGGINVALVFGRGPTAG
jgi:malonyl-ACP decarboxylase